MAVAVSVMMIQAMGVVVTVDGGGNGDNGDGVDGDFDDGGW